jgi:predicted permease
MVSLFDLKHAWRLLRKSWGYSLMSASVVAISVGLAVWTYALVYSQELKPLGFPGAEHWYSVQIATKATSTPRPNVDAYTYQELVANNRSASQILAFANRTVVLSEGQASTSLRAAAISPRLLAATQVAPLMGRTFQETDGLPGAGPVAVLSFDTWQQFFAADPSIIGKTARLDTLSVQIVGVMPAQFFVFQDFQVWLPLQTPRLARPGESRMAVVPLAVVDDEQKLTAVLNEMTTAVNRVNGDNPTQFDAGRHVALIQAHRTYTHSLTPIVVMLSLMAAAVMLLGCVNISLVFLARLLERSRELALRTALGATRARLVRQCLLETALIVVVGLALGYGLAAIGVRWARGLSDLSSQIEATGRDANVLVLRPIDLAVAVACATVVWLLSTLIPAWRVATQDAAGLLAGSGKGMAIRTSNRSVGLLVGLQVVISCLVLVVCGNVVLAVHEEVSRPTGLSTGQVMISTNPTVIGGRFTDGTQRLRYWEDLKRAIQSRRPGAEVAIVTAVPTIPGKAAATIETQQGTARQGTLSVPLAVVSDEYFSLLGLSLRSGRLFDSTDSSSSLNVAVVDERMAARYWPDGDVLGKRVRLDPAGEGPWLTIVGVVSAVAGQPFSNDDFGVLYRSVRQALPTQFHLLVKLPDAAGDNAVAVREAAFAVDRDLPLHNLQMLDDYLAVVNMASTALVPVVIVVALITALLAASGLFGLISRSVAQRTQEVGIRRALGATSWGATSMFRRQGAVYLSLSIAGLALGIIVMTLLSAQIPNIFGHIILTTMGVVLLMAAVIFLASYLPTRRAVALEPSDALRYE